MVLKKKVKIAGEEDGRRNPAAEAVQNPPSKLRLKAKGKQNDTTGEQVKLKAHLERVLEEIDSEFFRHIKKDRDTLDDPNTFNALDFSLKILLHQNEDLNLSSD